MTSLALAVPRQPGRGIVGLRSIRAVDGCDETSNVIPCPAKADNFATPELDVVGNGLFLA